MPGCDEHTAAKCPLWQKRAAEAVTLRLSAMQGISCTFSCSFARRPLDTT
jgi:hypothetical protein